MVVVGVVGRAASFVISKKKVEFYKENLRENKRRLHKSAALGQCIEYSILCVQTAHIDVDAELSTKLKFPSASLVVGTSVAVTAILSAQLVLPKSDSETPLPAHIDSSLAQVNSTQHRPIMPQPLNSKDQSLFRQVVRNFEQKQYKKGPTHPFSPSIL